MADPKHRRHPATRRREVTDADTGRTLGAVRAALNRRRLGGDVDVIGEDYPKVYDRGGAPKPGRRPPGPEVDKRRLGSQRPQQPAGPFRPFRPDVPLDPSVLVDKRAQTAASALANRRRGMSPAGVRLGKPMPGPAGKGVRASQDPRPGKPVRPAGPAPSAWQTKASAVERRASGPAGKPVRPAAPAPSPRPGKPVKLTTPLPGPAGKGVRASQVDPRRRRAS